MSTRVLANEEAHTAITNMQGIINGGLASTIQNLENQGQILSDPNNWDGHLAVQFRTDVWPAAHTALRNAHTQLLDLNHKLSAIHANIFAAGGNG